MNSSTNNIIFGFILLVAFIQVLIYYTSFGGLIFSTYRKFFNDQTLLKNENRMSVDSSKFKIVNKAISKPINVNRSLKFENVSNKTKKFKIYDYGHLKTNEDLFTAYETEEQLKTENEIFFESVITTTISNEIENLNNLMFESIENSELIADNLRDKTPSVAVNGSEYLINTNGCTIIAWPVFDSDTSKLYENHTQQVYHCKNKVLNGIEINRINGTSVQISSSDANNSQNIRCYSSFQQMRDTDDEADCVDYSTPVGVLENSINFPNAEFVKIQCVKESGLKRNFSKKKTGEIDTDFDELKIEEIIPLIPVLNKTKTRDNTNTVPNVLLLGIDSISRLNFQRHFPFTNKLLQQNNFSTLYGYNKVGLNTFPNMYPLLTGKMPDKLLLNESMSHKFKKHFDCEPLIWKEYAAKQFITLLVEDWPHYSIFNYRKRGFNHKPTDYYLRPFSLEIDDQIEDLCYNGKTEFQIYYQYVYDFVVEMRNREQSYFAFVFLAHLTHDELNYAGYADIPVYNFLAQLFNNSLLYNTVVMFFSDHGMRFGEIRQTHSGEIEARLPFFHIYLPQNTQFLTETEKSNLYRNQHRLTTPYDIHATLQHIIRGTPNNKSSAYGKSLFEEILDNRTCSDASIAEHYCACHQDIQLKHIAVFEPIATLIIDRVNQILANYLSKCYKLRLKRILTAYRRHILHEDEDDRQEIRLILLQVIASPSDAIFEATIRVFRHFEPELVGQISRLDKYGNQSYCVQHPTIERFCFCK